MVVCQGKHNAYYPKPDKGPGLICGTRRVRYYRGFLLIRPKDTLPAGEFLTRSSK
jgi:hypothetical protein